MPISDDDRKKVKDAFEKPVSDEEAAAAEKWVEGLPKLRDDVQVIATVVPKKPKKPDDKG